LKTTNPMKTILLKIRLILLIGLFGFIGIIQAQNTDVTAADFDVIVKKNGEIIHGKVMEVNLELIRYKRTDIPDGPIYVIPREDVFAISYRNQLTEYVAPVDSLFLSGRRFPSTKNDKTVSKAKQQGNNDLFPYLAEGSFYIGVGGIGNISLVSDIDLYTAENIGPGAHITYFFPFKTNLELGATVGYARFKYSQQLYSEYDQLKTNTNLTESLLNFGVLAKYSIDLLILKPYASGGISYISSSVKSTSEVTFIDDNRVVVVEGGSRSKRFGILMRIGVNVKLLKNFGVYGDVGTGLTLVQLGAVIKLSN